MACDTDELLAEAKCFYTLQPALLQVLMVQLLCTIKDNTSGAAPPLPDARELTPVVGEVEVGIDGLIKTGPNAGLPATLANILELAADSLAWKAVLMVVSSAATGVELYATSEAFQELYAGNSYDFDSISGCAYNLSDVRVYAVDTTGSPNSKVRIIAWQ